METRSSSSTPLSKAQLLECADYLNLSEKDRRLPKDKLYELVSTKTDIERLARRLRRSQKADKGSKSKTRNVNSKTSRKCGQNKANATVKSPVKATKTFQKASRSSPRRKTKRRRVADEGKQQKRRKAMCSAQEEKGSEAVNILDPITRAPLGKNVFTFSRPNGTIVRYDAKTLARYIVSTGDLLEPVSRVRFSDKDLKRLDSVNKKAGVRVGSAYEASKERDVYKENAVARNALVGLERCIGEVVHEMLSIIDAVVEMDADPESAETNLVVNMFPVLSHYLSLLKGMDKSYADQCLEQYISFVNGPPNNPTSNFMGFREHVIGFLKHLKG